MEGCWLAAHGVMEDGSPMPQCEGRLVRVHLIPREQLKKVSGWYASKFGINDSRIVVPGCGGIMGNGGHHHMLDFSKRLRIPRREIPGKTEQFAEEFGLTWWLDREYGPR